jgi:hypothetical protein
LAAAKVRDKGSATISRQAHAVATEPSPKRLQETTAKERITFDGQELRWLEIVIIT